MWSRSCGSSTRPKSTQRSCLTACPGGSSWLLSTKERCQLLLVRRVEQSPLSASVLGGDPPPDPGWWYHPTFPPEYVWYLLYCGVAAIQDRWFINWKGASSISHQRSLLLRHFSVTTCAPYSAGGIDLRCGGDVIRVRLHLWYVAAQRETSASPWRSGYSDSSSPHYIRARAGSYCQLAWFWLSDVPYPPRPHQRRCP